MSHDSEHLSIAELSARYSAGTSPVAVIERCLDRIASTNADLRALIHVAGDEALDLARRAERAGPTGPLHGIPFVVKDVIDVAGWPTTLGSRLEGGIARRDAACVARLRQAGAIPIGKANLHELTVGGFDNPWFGKVVNPLDPSRTTGGSSSGSAAAVRAGYCSFALGTDTGGSNRSPAAGTGLVGFKPTQDLLDMRGIWPTAGSMDTVGPIALSADDAGRVHDVLAGATSEAPPLAANALRIGWCPDLWGAPIDRTVAAAIDRWLSLLSGQGATVVTRPFAAAAVLREAGLAVLAFEFAAHYRPRIRQSPQDVGAGVHAFMAFADGITDAAYRDALSQCRRAADAMAALMDGIDVLACPVAPGLAPALADETTGVNGTAVPYGPAGGHFRRWVNAIGLPSLAMPLPGRDHLSASVQLVMAHGRDHDLLRLAGALQHTTNHK